MHFVRHIQIRLIRHETLMNRRSKNKISKINEGSTRINILNNCELV